MSTDHSTPIRSRFAPSPTGFLHLGGARTALFAWVFAKHQQGQFVLRIEDTDLERSTPEATQAILDAMEWLGLDYDEGPFYQTKRFDRYREALQQLIDNGHAYYCYSSPEEVEQMREAARARGDKPKYDGTWRPEPGKTLPPIPEGRKPVLRFRNPTEGEVVWDDLFKGTIRIGNQELDDLIIARADGTPTYNLCVVVDDYDMRITHVIRGDDHVNNTPRQINIFKALGAEPPVFGHMPMILGPDGQKLSKRHGAVNVMDYKTQGYLPEAMVNYLARLGWSHGDDEIFSREQFVEWFDDKHLSKASAQWDAKKLNWLNNHYIKTVPDARLIELLKPHLQEMGLQADDATLKKITDLVKPRAETLQQLAQDAAVFLKPDPEEIPEELRTNHLTPESLTILSDFAKNAGELPAWTQEALSGLIKSTIKEHGVKMPALGIPLRVALTGQKQTPSIDAVLEILGRETVLRRLQKVL